MVSRWDELAKKSTVWASEKKASQSARERPGCHRSALSNHETGKKFWRREKKYFDDGGRKHQFRAYLPKRITVIRCL